MSDTKSSSRSGSKADLNESAVPLLDDDGPDKESLEMKEKASLGSGAEKDDSNPEKKDDEKGSSSSEDEKKKEKKDKKKKKEKKKKEKKPKTPSQPCRASHCVQNLTVGLNILDRDDKGINNDVNIAFEDVLAEPEVTHGFDALWRLTFLVFTGTRFWLYRIASLFLALPAAILWGIVFSLISLLHIWIISPIFKIVEVGLSYVRRLLTAVIGSTIEPLFRGIGAIRHRGGLLQEV